MTVEEKRLLEAAEWLAKWLPPEDWLGKKLWKLLVPSACRAQWEQHSKPFRSPRYAGLYKKKN